jgi:hypothetical protein
LKHKIDVLERQLVKNNEIISKLGKKIDDEASNLHKNKPKIAELDENKESRQILEQNEEKVERDQEQAVVRKPATQPYSFLGGQCASKTAKTDVQVISDNNNQPIFSRCSMPT